MTLRFVGEHVTEVVTAIGQRGVRAEAVAAEAVAEAKRYLDSGAPVGEHLADQLLIPLALSRGDSFMTGPLTEHTTTNIGVIQKYLNVEFTVRTVGDSRFEIAVGG